MNNNTLKSIVWTRALKTLAAISIAAMVSSCAHLNLPEPTPEPEPAVVEKKPPPKPIKPPPPSPLYEWWGKDYVSHIEVSINEQKARFYEGDQMVGWTTVASGVHKFPTPTGTFAVTEKVQDKKSNLYGKIYNRNGKLVRRNAKMGVHKIPAGGRFKGAPMPYFMRLTNDGIGMHAGPIPKPGNRASHGCIRMPRNFAPILYRHVDIGTAVTIKGNGPTYASYAAKQRKPTPKRTAVAVAKTDASATNPSSAGASVAAAHPGPAQPVAAASPSSSPTGQARQPATSATSPDIAPTRVTATPPSYPTAPTAPPMTGTAASSAGASIPTAPTTPTASAPTVAATPAMPTASASATAIATPPPAMSQTPLAAPPSASTPTTVVTPIPVQPQAPMTAPPAPPSMTSAPAGPTPPASQTTPPVLVPTQPQTATGPTEQAGG